VPATVSTQQQSRSQNCNVNMHQTSHHSRSCHILLHRSLVLSTLAWSLLSRLPTVSGHCQTQQRHSCASRVLVSSPRLRLLVTTESSEMASALRLMALAVLAAVATASRVLQDIPETIPNKRVFAVRNALGLSCGGSKCVMVSEVFKSIHARARKCSCWTRGSSWRRHPRLHGATEPSALQQSASDLGLSCLPHRKITGAPSCSTLSTCTTSFTASDPAVQLTAGRCVVSPLHSYDLPAPVPHL
jgi:hypothetical protein